MQSIIHNWYKYNNCTKKDPTPLSPDAYQATLYKIIIGCFIKTIRSFPNRAAGIYYMHHHSKLWIIFPEHSYPLSIIRVVSSMSRRAQGKVFAWRGSLE